MWKSFKKFLQRLEYVLRSEKSTGNKAGTQKNTARSGQPSAHTCVHECGHYMVASLFPEAARRNILSANKKRLPKGMNGALHITQLAGQEITTSTDKMMLICAGGISAATIHTYGIAYTRSNLSVFPYNSSLMDRDGADGDYAMMQEFSKTVGFDIRFKKQPSYVMWTGIQLVLLFLMEPLVWNAIELLANKLRYSENYEMTPNEVDKFLGENIDTAKLDLVKNKYKNMRYPLTKEILSTLY